MSVSELSLQGQVIDRRSFTASTDAYYSSVLNLTTQEGDRVHFSFNAEQSYSETQSETQSQDNGTVQEFSSVAVAASRYSLAVEGDLNEEELTAIQKLSREIAPIAESFFKDGTFDIKKATETLSGNLGVIQELELALEKIQITTVSAETVSRSQVTEGAVPDPQLPEAQEVPADVPVIRNLSELVFSSVAAEFEAQAANSVPDESILRTLGDLLQFIRERLGDVLEPLSNRATPPDNSQSAAPESVPENAQQS